MDELDRLSDVAKMNLEFSETSSMASDVSSLERVKFRDGSESDATTDEENENAFLPGPQCREKESDSSALGTFVSSLTFPDLNLISRNLLTNMMASVSTSQAQPKMTVHSRSNCNTDDEFEFVNASDLN